MADFLPQLHEEFGVGSGAKSYTRARDRTMMLALSKFSAEVAHLHTAAAQPIPTLPALTVQLCCRANALERGASMSDWKLPRDGGCLCGAVRFRISAPPLLKMACHCTGCQKLSASAYSLTIAIPTAGFEITRGER
jgi:hypothetical protein